MHDSLIKVTDLDLSRVEGVKGEEVGLGLSGERRYKQPGRALESDSVTTLIHAAL